MRPSVLRFLAALCLAPALAAAQPARPARVVTLEGIVAVVNNEIITRRELAERITVVTRQLEQQRAPLPPRDVLERQVLERLITDRVQLQFARETGIIVDDAFLEKAIERIAEQNRMSMAQLRQVLQKDGIPFTRFREDIRSEIVLARLREREVDNKIVVTEGEVDIYLQSQQPQSGKVDEYNVSHILVQVQEGSSPEQLQARRARAEEALTQIRAGTDFRQVAATFSDAPDAVQGGALGWREAGRMPSLFAEAVKGLRPGEVSPILRSSNGFHIVRLNERRGTDAPLIVPQTRTRHILIKTNELVSDNEAQSKLVKIKERIDHGGDFAQLARLNSDDSSAQRGGDLGWISPGDTVPEFERAMDALKIGQVSEPVRSPFGWHLIQVQERRTQDMSGDQQRLRARQTLRAQKAEEAYQEWLRQLRDRAFVERRLEER